LLPLHPELVRGLAVGYAAAGAAGLNFFNYFTPREEHPPLTPEVSVLGELREPQGLRGRPKTYTVNGEASVTHGGVPETDRPAQLPVVLGERSCRDFRLLMMAEPEATAVTAEIRFTGDPGPEPGQLWLRLNAHAAGSARALETVPDTEQQPVSVARWALPAAALRNGWNRLQLRNEGREITLLGVDLLVNTRR